MNIITNTLHSLNKREKTDNIIKPHRDSPLAGWRLGESDEVRTITHHVEYYLFKRTGVASFIIRFPKLFLPVGVVSFLLVFSKWRPFFFVLLLALL